MLIEGGLFAILAGESKEVAMCGSNVHAKLVDFAARVEVTQTFVNRFATAIETTYVFPLDDRAAVCEFESIIDGVSTKGVVQEKTAARNVYKSALAAGKQAQLLEQKRGDVFEIHVGNIKPGQMVIIKMVYVCDVPIEGDAIRFFVPANVAPRYSPREERDPVPSTSLRNVPFGLNITVDAIMPTEIMEVTSPSHTISTAFATSSALGRRSCSITLTHGPTHLDKDFVVLLTIKDPHQPRMVIERHPEDGTHTCMITLAPKLELDEVPCEVLFLIDRSGSMSAEGKMESASRALQLFLRSLPSNCYLNIIGFGSSFSMLWQQSQKNSPTNLAQALHYASTMDADMGGTELLAPLHEVLSKPAITNYARQVFIVTDGQVSNTAAVIKEAGAHSSARCFALGLGASASHELVNGIARAGRGTAVFASTGDRLEPKVLGQLAQALQPGLTEVDVDWGKGAVATKGEVVGDLVSFRSKGGPFVQAPSEVPPVFNGHRFMIFCLFGASHKPPTKVTITAQCPDGTLKTTLTPKPEDMYTDTMIHTLAAKARIRELEDQSITMSLNKGVSDEIVRLGCKYSLVSSKTSFVSVVEPPAAEPLDSSSKFCYASCSTIGQARYSSASSRYYSQFSSPAGISLSAMPQEVRYKSAGCCGGGGSSYRPVPPTPAPAPTPAPVAKPANRGRGAVSINILAIANLQSFEGSWSSSKELASHLQMTAAELENSMPPALSKFRDVWITAVVLEWLELYVKSRHDEWQLLERKARKWMGTQHSVSELLMVKDAAVKFVQTHAP